MGGEDIVLFRDGGLVGGGGWVASVEYLSLMIRVLVEVDSLVGSEGLV